MKETCTCSFEFKQNIREINFSGLKIGGDKSFFFLKENGNKSKPVFVLELNIFKPEKSSHIVKDVYSQFFDNKIEFVKQAQNSDCDILGLKFNIENIGQVNEACLLLKDLLPHIRKPLMIRGVNISDLDKILIPELMKTLDRECIIAFANEYTYKEITPLAIKGNHILVIRTPIDVNKLKEMNLLTSKMGLDLNKILIDTDMGGLGYGLEYGYSIMERVKIAGFNGNEILNMPMIAFSSEESLKTKEASSENLNGSFGDFKTRTKMIEVVTASSVISAGVNVVVLNHPESIHILKGLVG
ncbi:hypothetical protein IJ818_01930 [bacterium]|nr:hypothetical protein [bacterium]